MSVKYYKEDDLLAIRLSRRPFEVAEKVGQFVIHYDKNRNPVLLEILNASKILRQTSKALPEEMRRKFVAGA